jgi:hypothetical protein
MAQGEGPEFKHQYYQKKKKKRCTHKRETHKTKRHLSR